jgi:hypothetical protein
MPRVGFEPMIPAYERAKTVRALNCAVTVISYQLCLVHVFITEYMTAAQTGGYALTEGSTVIVYIWKFAEN